MRFGGFQPFTLSDYPGCVAAIAFTQGCNFRCPFCHNGGLISARDSAEAYISPEEILAALQARRGRLDGLVVSGGEPTIQPGLSDFLSRVKSLGYRVKIDTNGSHPEVLQALLAQHLIDYIAMDIKAPFAKYDLLCGASVPSVLIARSIEVVRSSGIPHQFRTTAVLPLLTPCDMQEIRCMVPADSDYRIQPFHPENALDPALRAAVANA